MRFVTVPPCPGASVTLASSARRVPSSRDEPMGASACARAGDYSTHQMRLAAHAAQLPSKAMGCGLFVLWMAAGILAAILFNTGGGGPLFGVLVLGLAAWVHW